MASEWRDPNAEVWTAPQPGQVTIPQTTFGMPRDAIFNITWTGREEEDVD